MKANARSVVHQLSHRCAAIHACNDDRLVDDMLLQTE